MQDASSSGFSVVGKMRISASTTMLTLAIYLGAVVRRYNAAQIDHWIHRDLWDRWLASPDQWLRPSVGLWPEIEFH